MDDKKNKAHEMAKARTDLAHYLRKEAEHRQFSAMDVLELCSYVTDVALVIAAEKREVTAKELEFCLLHIDAGVIGGRTMFDDTDESAKTVVQ